MDIEQPEVGDHLTKAIFLRSIDLSEIPHAFHYTGYEELVPSSSYREKNEDGANLN
jgi:hypothetical protein